MMKQCQKQLQQQRNIKEKNKKKNYNMEFNKINKKLKLIKVRFLKKVKSIGPNYRNQPISKDLNKSQKLSVGIFFKLLKK